MRRAIQVAALVALLLFACAPAALAGESFNPWDRPEDPLETAGNADDQGQAVTPQEEAEAAERCSSVVGLPASIGCRLVTLGGGGLDAATGLAGGLAASVAVSAFDAFVDAVADGAIWFLSKVAAFLDSSTRPPIMSPWFGESYDTMLALTGIVVLPLVLVAIIDAVVHARPGQVVRTLFVFLPLAGIVSYVALELVDLALTITDWMAAFISGGVAADSAAFLEGMGSVLSGTAGEQLPSFALFIGGIFAVFGAFVLWIELILRDAAISLSVLFLPLAFATMVWPRVARWASRALRTLAALILSKVFIVAVISLGASMLSGVGAGAGLESVVAGVALLGLATFAPWVLWRLLAPVEGALDVALEGATRTPTAAVGRPAATSASGVATRFGGAAAGGPLPVAGATAGATASSAMLGAVAAADAARTRAEGRGGTSAAAAGGAATGGAGEAAAAARRRQPQPAGNGAGRSADPASSGGVAPVPASSGVNASSGAGAPLPVRSGDRPTAEPPPPASPPPPSAPPPGRQGP